MAGTGAGRKVSISDAPIPDADMDASEFEALTYIEIGRVGNVQGGGASTNFPTYSELNRDVADKKKGVTTPEDITIELRPFADDLGQAALKEAMLTRFVYAIKIEEDDAPDEGTTNTIYYNRGSVGVPQEGFGGADDFRTKTYTIGAQQVAVEVPPEPIA